MQKYFRTRENRNFSTVKSTEQRIFNFSLVEVAMMVGMAALQVLVVRFFFQGARKGKYLKAMMLSQDVNFTKVMFDLVHELLTQKKRYTRLKNISKCAGANDKILACLQLPSKTRSNMFVSTSTATVTGISNT